MDRDGHTLEQYVRHARFYGIEFVYETAEQERMSAKELFELAQALRRRDARFSLTDMQIERLVFRGISADQLHRALGVSSIRLSRALTRAGAT